MINAETNIWTMPQFKWVCVCSSLHFRTFIATGWNVVWQPSWAKISLSGSLFFVFVCFVLILCQLLLLLLDLTFCWWSMYSVAVKCAICVCLCFRVCATILPSTCIISVVQKHSFWFIKCDSKIQGTVVWLYVNIEDALNIRQIHNIWFSFVWWLVLAQLFKFQEVLPVLDRGAKIWHRLAIIWHTFFYCIALKYLLHIQPKYVK